MFNRRSLLTVCAVAAVAVLGAASMDAWTSEPRLNHLTFNRSVTLPGVVLAPGAYTFEVAVPTGSSDIVRVRSRDGRRVYYTGFTIGVRRPHGMPADRALTFGEAPAGEAIPITAWYPIGLSTGYQFLYR